MGSIDKIIEFYSYTPVAIYEIVDQAVNERNHKTNAFLQWFVNEQAEEETSENNLRKLHLVGDDGRGILMLNAELRQRVYAPPADAAAQG